MGLETIRNCSIREIENYVIISGICKLSDRKVEIKLEKQDFEDWRGGLPLSYLASYLTRKEKTFLQTGILK